MKTLQGFSINSQYDTLNTFKMVSTTLDCLYHTIYLTRHLKTFDFDYNLEYSETKSFHKTRWIRKQERQQRYTTIL